MRAASTSAIGGYIPAPIGSVESEGVGMAIEVDGVAINETSRGSGAAWKWSSAGPTPIDYEIQWVENKDVFL